VAEQYGISRTPVRDALRQLQNEGVITIFPNRFAQVSEYSEQDIREVGYLRLALDRLAVQLALKFGSYHDFLQLEQLAEACLQAYRVGDRRLRSELDAEFHQALSGVGGNHLLLKFQSEISVRVKFILIYYRENHKDEEIHLLQHLEIVEALRKHDWEKLQKLVRQHLTAFYGIEGL
jgi:DNA-binding GntR family transcriptional regulator